MHKLAAGMSMGTSFGSLRSAKFLVALAVVCFGFAPLGMSQKVSIEQGFPLDTVLYVEADMTGGLASVADFNRFTAAGAIGLGYDDMAEALRGPLRLKPEDRLPISGKDIEAMVTGTKRIGGGLIDIVLNGVTWSMVIEHENPRVFLDIIEAAADNNALVLEPVKDVKEHQIYELKFPETWFELLRLVFNPRRFFWNMRNTIDSYGEPVFLSIWNDKYFVVSSRKNDLLDALDFYDFPEDTEETLAGNRAFKDCRAETKGEDLVAFWNLGSTITKVERVSGQNEMLSQVYSVMEVKQFRSFVLSMKYDTTAGTLNSTARLSFHNRPSWIEVLPFSPKPTALANFSPRRPASFTSMDIGNPKELWEKIRRLIKEKSEAMGQADAAKELDEQIAEFATRQGFSLDDILSQLGSRHAMISISPFRKDGTRRRGVGSAFVVELADEAKGREFIEEKLLKSPDARDVFHVKERAFVETAKRGKIGYRVFASDTEDSFAWLVLDGFLIAGTQDSVREVVVAYIDGENLETDPEWQSFEKTMTSGGLYTTYADFRYLSEHAAAVFTADSDMDLDVYDLESNLFEVDEQAPTADPTEATLASKLFGRHLPHLRTGGRIVLQGNSVEMIQNIAGAPTSREIPQMVLTVSRHNGWLASQTNLANTVVPEMAAWIMKNGDLPADVNEFTAKGGQHEMFRDPMLAGPAVKTITPEVSYVWVGKHGDRSILPAVPLVHTRAANESGKYLLAMSDGSVHRVSKEQLDEAIAAAADPEKVPPFKSSEPQTLDELLEKMKPQVR